MFMLAEQFQVPGIPATMALAAVALVGYLAGRHARPAVTADPAPVDVDEALAGVRQLEQITDDMLSVTREALEKCRMLRLHGQPPAGMPQPRPSAEYAFEGQMPRDWRRVRANASA
jgi:hypothetical protein